MLQIRKRNKIPVSLLPNTHKKSVVNTVGKKIHSKQPSLMNWGEMLCAGRNNCAVIDKICSDTLNIKSSLITSTPRSLMVSRVYKLTLLQN